MIYKMMTTHKFVCYLQKRLACHGAGKGSGCAFRSVPLYPDSLSGDYMLKMDKHCGKVAILTKVHKNVLKKSCISFWFKHCLPSVSFLVFVIPSSPHCGRKKSTLRSFCP